MKPPSILFRSPEPGHGCNVESPQVQAYKVLLCARADELILPSEGTLLSLANRQSGGYSNCASLASTIIVLEYFHDLGSYSVPSDRLYLSYRKVKGPADR